MTVTVVEGQTYYHCPHCSLVYKSKPSLKGHQTREHWDLAEEADGDAAAV